MTLTPTEKEKLEAAAKGVDKKYTTTELYKIFEQEKQKENEQGNKV